MDLVGSKARRLVGNKRERRLRVATWTFSGLFSDGKQKEVGELIMKHNLDVAGQESWKKEKTRIEVEGYKWFEKPRSKQNSLRGEGGVGFLKYTTNFRGDVSWMISILLRQWLYIIVFQPYGNGLVSIIRCLVLY